MALIHCPECNKEISSSAETCPNCGYPLSKSGNEQTVEQNEVQGVMEQSQIEEEIAEHTLETQLKESSELSKADSGTNDVQKITYIILGVLAVIAIIVFATTATSNSAPDLSEESDAEVTSRYVTPTAEEKEMMDNLESAISNTLNYVYGADASVYARMTVDGVDLHVSVNTVGEKYLYGYYLYLTMEEINDFLKNNDLSISDFDMYGKKYTNGEESIFAYWISSDLKSGIFRCVDDDYLNASMSYGDVLKYCDYVPE